MADTVGLGNRGEEQSVGSGVPGHLAPDPSAIKS